MVSTRSTIHCHRGSRAHALLLTSAGALAVMVALAGITRTWAQSVCLPAPRLLTTMPMGGQVGTEFDLTITGQAIDEVEQLLFSNPGITAKPKLAEDGSWQENTFVVTISAHCPVGIHEARVTSRLGVSTARVFTVGVLPEVTQDEPSLGVAAATRLDVNSICNAIAPQRAVNHFTFDARQGRRYIIDCAAKGIDSKMNPVLVIADAEGNDLVVERRGGALDFRAPVDGPHIIKVHELTFQGGPEHFFRLVVQEVAMDAVLPRSPSTRSVSTFSWPPAGLSSPAPLTEVEPNDEQDRAQSITLPCDIAGSFCPAADVDTFEFAARKGDVWWVEVASERLGHATDPSVVVQHLSGEGTDTSLVDVVELTDIASPVKRSSNGYAYDGPPYNAGSLDVLGKVEIKHDGIHRLQLSDLFGGTRDEPRNKYRLIVRKAAPDFALVAWALHMELRNGDRSALSKPIALRGGATMAMEVVAIRRDGFDGDIELSIENLPEGVTATGLKIASGSSRGVMLVTAAEDAPRGMHIVRFSGRGVIDGVTVVRPCQFASLAWPVTDSWSEIPAPRLLSSLPVSVGGSETAALTIAARENKVWEGTVGRALTIPLSHVRRGELSGATIGLRAFGAGFDHMPKFEVSLESDNSQAVLDLAQLNTPAGDYEIAFYGHAVAKYRSNPNAVIAAQHAFQQAQRQVTQVTRNERGASNAEEKAAQEALSAAKKRVEAAQRHAQPKEIVDIIISQPIAVRINPAEPK